MWLGRTGKIIGALTLASVLMACGGPEGRDIFGRTQQERIDQQVNPATIARDNQRRNDSIFDLFANADDPNVTVEVNRYLWNASIDVLNFMPIEAADPFSGVIQYGFGTPPGSRQAYQATVFIKDPALDARSLNVSLRTRGGPVNQEVQRQIEDAILTRARQLRIADSAL